MKKNRRFINIINATHHNLKGFDLLIPREELTVVCGPSGSGKSTLAFDIVYAEGQRRYVESLSAYARQFLPQLDKPRVEKIEGLSPAISIEQHTLSKNPRSTVATVTEIYDFLRVLWARLGTAHCIVCNKPLISLTPDAIISGIVEKYSGETITLLAVLSVNQKGTHRALFESLLSKGFSRVRINNEIFHIEDAPALDKKKKHYIELVIDRIKVTDKNRSRLADGVSQALKEGNETFQVLADNKIDTFTTSGGCAEHNFSVENAAPSLFSFNTPVGFCPECFGIGSVNFYDEELLFENDSLSIETGALDFLDTSVVRGIKPKLDLLGKKYSFSLDTPIKNFTPAARETLFSGDPKLKWHGLNKILKTSERFGGIFQDKMAKYRKKMVCPVCHGSRLNKKALSIKINDLNIFQFTNLSVIRAINWVDELKFPEYLQSISTPLLTELTHRLSFLNRVGLGYITLSREMATLSGGEAQRIRLASQLGTGLTGVTYVLDEPSIGLHQMDNKRLIETLVELRDRGNTVIVVEHDEQTILSADNIVELGPGSGSMGGEVVFKGTVEKLKSDRSSLTAKYLRGEMYIEKPESRRKHEEYILLKGVKTNNIQNLDVAFPTGCITCVTGVSGSGKSSLVVDTLHRELQARLRKNNDHCPTVDDIFFPEKLNRVVIIDQSPIGRTPRSNPATYTKVLDDIRDIFAGLPESKVNGFKKGRFSFNVPGGRCEKCAGDGEIRVEMLFLPDVFIQCDECNGDRYNKETLKVKYRNKNISDVLKMTVQEAYDFFEPWASLRRKIGILMDVGLDYIQLGQSATTLSGGEAQRIKISRELGKTHLPGTVYILDEPTTGLHMHEVGKLIDVLNSLVERGATVILIEHNLDVIKASDYVIDMGPGGGENGGLIVSSGTPEDIINDPKSVTGEFLQNIHDKFQ